MVSFVRLGPRSTPKEMALTSQLSQAVKVAAIEKINDIVDFADSIADRLSQQNYATVLLVLWCGLAVSVVRSRRRSALLQKQLDKLGQDVRQLEFTESRRLMEAMYSRSRSETRTQQQDVPSIMSSEETGGG
jgi:acetolactate synthase regulatory subunit